MLKIYLFKKVCLAFLEVRNLVQEDRRPKAGKNCLIVSCRSGANNYAGSFFNPSA